MQPVCCGASVFAPGVLRPLLLFVMELSIGDRVFYTRCTGLWVPAKVVGLLHNGHVALEHDQGGVRVVNHGCPMDSISFGIPSLKSPPPSPSIPAIGVSHEVLLDPLVDGSICSCSPTHRHHIPHPEASLGDGVGTQCVTMSPLVSISPPCVKMAHLRWCQYHGLCDNVRRDDIVTGGDVVTHRVTWQCQPW